MLVRVPVRTDILYCSQPIAKFRYFVIEIAEVNWYTQNIKKRITIVWLSTMLAPFQYKCTRNSYIYSSTASDLSRCRYWKVIEITLRAIAWRATSTPQRCHNRPVLRVFSSAHPQTTMTTTTRKGTTTTRRPPTGRGGARRRRSRRRTRRAVRPPSLQTPIREETTRMLTDGSEQQIYPGSVCQCSTSVNHAQLAI